VEQSTYMNVPRRDHGAAVFGEFLYVVGGWNMEPYYTSTERFHLDQGPGHKVQV